MAASAGDNEHGRINFIIRASGEKNGLYVDPISTHSGENEVILPRGATYVIRKAEWQPNQSYGKPLTFYVDLIGYNRKPLP